MTTYQMLLVLIQSKFAHLSSFPWGPRYSRVKLVKALDTFFMHACPYKLARFNFPSKPLTSNFQAGDDLFARAKRGDPDAKKILKEQMLEIFNDALPEIDKIITKRANEKIGDLKTGLTAGARSAGKKAAEDHYEQEVKPALEDLRDDLNEEMERGEERDGRITAVETAYNEKLDEKFENHQNWLREFHGNGG